MTHQGWPGQGNLRSGNQPVPSGAGDNQPGDQFGQPSWHQPQYGQAQPEQFGQPQYGQTPYGQTQYGPHSGQAQYGQPPQADGWGGPAATSSGGPPPAPKKNWLLFGGIGAGVIIVALVVALVLQALDLGEASPSTSPHSTGSALPSDASTDKDGIPVFPVTLYGKVIPTQVDTFELHTSNDPTFGRSTAIIYFDRSVSPTASLVGTYHHDSSVAALMTNDLTNVKRIGNFLCGRRTSLDLNYCVAKSADGTIYFFSGAKERPVDTLVAQATGVVTGAR